MSVYAAARKLLGLDKEEEKGDGQGKGDLDLEGGEGTPELQVIQELRELASKHMDIDGKKIEVKPVGKAGYAITVVFSSETAARNAFGG